MIDALVVIYATRSIAGRVQNVRPGPYARSNFYSIL